MMKRPVAIFIGVLLIGLFAGCYGVLQTHAQGEGDVQPNDSEYIQWDSQSYTATSTFIGTGSLYGEVDYDWCWEDEEYQLGYRYTSAYGAIDPGTMVSIVGGEGEHVSVPVTVQQQAVQPEPGCTDDARRTDRYALPRRVRPTLGPRPMPAYSYTQNVSAYPGGNYTLFATIDPTDCTPANYNSSANFGSAPTPATCQNFANEASLTISEAPPSVPTVSFSASPASVTLGSPTTLTWSSANATACMASGSWSGSQSTSGTVNETPSAVGIATYTITCTGPGGTSAPASASVTVNPPAVATGTITVTSENATGTHNPVNATWQFVAGNSLTYPSSAYPIVTPCDLGMVCTGSAVTTLGQPAIDQNGLPGVLYSIPEGSVALANPSQSNLYSFNSIRMVPIARKNPGNGDSLLSLIKDVFSPTAEAWNPAPGYPLSQTLEPGSTTAYIILWDPVANISVSSTALSLTSTQGSSTSGQVQISNDGAQDRAHMTHYIGCRTGITCNTAKRMAFGFAEPIALRR